MKVVIVVPTYNERDNIGPLLDALHDLPLPHFFRLVLLVVDDDSPDGTAAVVLERRQRHGMEIYLLSGARVGLGAAYIRGLSHALARFAPDVVIQMDADFSHSPHDVLRLLEAIDAGADLAIGSRYVGGDRNFCARLWNRRFLSWIGNLVARHWLHLASVKDCTAGFRAWRADALNQIGHGSVTARGYVFQVAMLQRAVFHGMKIQEIPVRFPDRVHGVSKLGWGDMLEFANWTCINHPLFRRKQ